jgi:hypothetical protein
MKCSSRPVILDSKMNQREKEKWEPGFENVQNLSKKLIISRGTFKYLCYFGQ